MEPKTSKSTLLTPKNKKIVLLVGALVLALIGFRAFNFYRYIFNANVKQAGGFIIPRSATLDQVTDSLKKHDLLHDYKAFTWVANRKKYPKAIKAGHYSVKPGMTTNQVVNMLVSGTQTPVRLTFNNVRFFKELAADISKYIEPDSVKLFARFSDPAIMAKYGFNVQTFPMMFIPDTYEVYWTLTPEQFIDRMFAEYKKFWNESRKGKAKALGLTPAQVATVASIVQEETAKRDEKPKIAGLYLNRLRKGMLLQADPTVKFAVGDFSIRRVLNSHLKVESPYNTYKHVGLPPGPINFPETSSIDAVLNAQKHSYLYMCAKEDFSGYHNFATSLNEHGQNAKRYQQALNNRKIFK